MSDKSFNLVHEPWIRVVTNSCEEREVSLSELFAHAHEYRRLAGETPAYDATMTRMLLAIVETVFYRYTADGSSELITPDTHTAKDVLDRWNAYYKQGKFGTTFQTYLEQYSGRFWLFHPNVPFYQVHDLQYGTRYQIKSVVGTLKESNNKATKHLFSMTEGTNLEQLEPAEAARCLLFYNGFCANVKQDKKPGVPGSPDPVSIGRMGALGFIMAEGSTLFDTLMLNLCALRDGEFVWGSPKPSWEEPVCDLQARLIEMPDNLPQAYTMLSRRMYWHKSKDSDSVIALQALGGDYYPLANDTTEQMTLWKTAKLDDSKDAVLYPKRHSAGYHLWREFSNLVASEIRIPGLILWLSQLCDNGLVPQDTILSIRSVGMDYADSMRYVFGDCFSDSMALSLGLLGKMGEPGKQVVCEEVQKCAQVREEIRIFAWKVTKILYGEDRAPEFLTERLTASFYSTVDTSFRQWLLSFCGDFDPEEKKMEWEKTVYRLAADMADSYVESLGNAVFRMKNTKKTGKAHPESILEVLNWYKKGLRDIYPKDVKKEEDDE